MFFLFVMAFNRDLIFEMGRSATIVWDLIDFIVFCFYMLSNNGFAFRKLQELGISLVSFFLVLELFLHQDFIVKLCRAIQQELGFSLISTCFLIFKGFYIKTM